MPKPLKTFIIYARHDKRFKDELMYHLSPFLKMNRLVLWHDGDILPGEEWEKSIMTNLEESQIVLMLVSAHSLFSDFIQKKELKKSLQQKSEGKTLLIPILVADCLYELAEELTRLEILPTHPETGKLVPVEDIRSWGTHNSAWATALRRLRFLIDEINNRIEEEEKAKIQSAEEAKRLKFGKFTFNKNNSELKKWGLPPVKLPNREAELLKLLIESRGEFVSTSFILESIWGKDEKIASSASLSFCVSKLREYFEGDKSIEIETARGKGYALRVNE